MTDLQIKETRISPAGDWILAHVTYTGDKCLKWPFSTIWNGYGQVWVDGKCRKAHRVMCLLAHGEPPTPSHVAAHSCNNGTGGCVHPGHLSWKTPAENQIDRRRHGTAKRKTYWSRTNFKVTEAQKEKIRRLKGKWNQRQIAEMFKISYQHVSLIQRGLTRQPKRGTR